MKLLDKLAAVFAKVPPGITNDGVFLEHLRNVFYAAEVLKTDLQHIPACCGCEDAIAHFEGRCTCTEQPGGERLELGAGRGCLAHLETLESDASCLWECVRRGKNEVRIRATTDELQHELRRLEAFAERVRDIAEEVRNHAADWELSCANDALQRLKETGSEIDSYASEFFWSLLKYERGAARETIDCKMAASEQERN